MSRNINASPAASAALVPSQRRLQRPPDFTGGRLTSFRQVALRHGLPGALLAAACLALPHVAPALDTVLQPFTRGLPAYLALFAGIALAQCAWSWRLNGTLRAADAGWSLYLLALSGWEELLFRLALPLSLVRLGLDPWPAILVANLVFGVVHWFTLRWRWPWCVLALVGGLVLSRHLAVHADLAAIVALHWASTFVNTPRIPGRALSQCWQAARARAASGGRVFIPPGPPTQPGAE